MGCSNNDSSKYRDIPINKSYIDSLLKVNGTDKLAILATRACGCFQDSYGEMFKKSGHGPEGYMLMTDTAFVKLPFPAKHIPVSEMYKLSPDFYNLVLFKRTADSIVHKVVRVSESEKLEKVTKRFFE